MKANASLSFLHKHFLSPGHSLSKSDAVQILGAVLRYLTEKDIVCSLSEMHANHSAQGTVLKLRHELWRETYGRSL
jgi:hypothetical protein